MSETGISETSPVLPNMNGDSTEGGDDGIRTLLRRGELACNEEVLCSGDGAERRALEGEEDVRVWDE